MKIQVALPIAMLMLGAFTSSGALELPTQKPGMWQMTMTGAKIPGGSRSFSICQDAAFIAAAKASTDAHLKNDCSKHDLRKEGNTWVADMDCTFSGMHAVSHSVTTIHGDDAYHTEMTSSTGSPKHAGTSSVMTIDNKWLGACKPGQKVGVPEAAK
jgi:hypothetical protein